MSSNRVIVTGDGTADVVSIGIQGPAGPQGVSGDKNYTQDLTNQSTVTVNHNLSKYPAVTIFDPSNDGVTGEVEHVSVNQLVLTFSSSFTGKVICN